MIWAENLCLPLQRLDYSVYSNTCLSLVLEEKKSLPPSFHSALKKTQKIQLFFYNNTKENLQLHYLDPIFSFTHYSFSWGQENTTLELEFGSKSSEINKKTYKKYISTRREVKLKKTPFFCGKLKPTLH